MGNRCLEDQHLAKFCEAISVQANEIFLRMKERAGLSFFFFQKQRKKERKERKHLGWQWATKKLWNRIERHQEEDFDEEMAEALEGENESDEGVLREVDFSILYFLSLG